MLGVIVPALLRWIKSAITTDRRYRPRPPLDPDQSSSYQTSHNGGSFFWKNALNPHKVGAAQGSPPNTYRQKP